MAWFLWRMGRAGLRAAVLVGLITGCSSTKTSGDRVASVDRPDTGDVAPPADASATSVCVTNDDCVISNFSRPVTSADDCYCSNGCGGAVTKSLAAVYHNQWQQFCTTWMDASQCIPPPCIPLEAQCTSTGSCEVRP